MCLRKTSTINVYINIVYKLDIYYSVYRSKDILQITVIEINCQRFINDLLTSLLTILLTILSTILLTSLLAILLIILLTSLLTILLTVL